MKNKIIFLGETNSINLELIFKSFKKIYKKVKYIIIADLKTIENSIEIKMYNININEVLDPIGFTDYNSNALNIFNIACGKSKIDNMLSQLTISNKICNLQNYELITMPINKYLFKKKISKFIGMTEFLGNLNNVPTTMLMVGENFSIIPITTHIVLNQVSKKLKKKIHYFVNKLNQFNNKTKFLTHYESVVFLCINPHCGENGINGKEDLIIQKKIRSLNFKNVKLLAADSAFKNYNRKTLFISFYHDQALIPFKILNKKSFNQTLGLKYKRLSPSHGTAEDIKLKNIADNTSYIQCMIN